MGIKPDVFNTLMQIHPHDPESRCPKVCFREGDPSDRKLSVDDMNGLRVGAVEATCVYRSLVHTSVITVSLHWLGV